MNGIARKILSLTLALALLASMATIPAFAEGEKLWTETTTADGWIMVTNEGGATLGYSPNSGLALVEADGYAFKDLNRNGQLDVYEDWRVDYETRAQALVDSGELSTEWMMGLKMNPLPLMSPPSDKVLDDALKTKLDAGYRFIRYSKTNADIVVAWNNLIQEYVESNDKGVVIPATYMDDPFTGNGVSVWPSNLGIAATFDPEIAAQYGEMMSKEWRTLGLTMQVGPQVDIATEPRWKRISGTFGEDPQLVMDMAVALVNGLQSTYDEEGNDLGWGADSVNVQIKHLTGDGAAEGGRESHTVDGAFNVYPGDQFYTALLPFIACLNLPGKTGSASGAMTNYSIAVDANGDPLGNEFVSTSFNRWKLTEVWREQYGFDGYIITDFDVTGADTVVITPYGVEGITYAERLLKLLEAGCDSFGGDGDNLTYDDMAEAMTAYALGVEKYGQEEMDSIMAVTTVRILKTLFNVGVVDNPYLSKETARAVANNDEHNQAGFDAQLKSIVMLKNSSNLIQAATEEKKTIYIPWKYTDGAWAPTYNLQTALRYFNVVTDTIGQPTGEAGEDGKATYTDQDIVRASAEDIATCDFALVRIASPATTNTTLRYNADLTIPEGYEYLPISLQYRPYTADSMYVRFDSIGGFVKAREVQGTYGMETVYEKENRSYYGKSTTTSNEADLDLALYAASVADKVVVAIDASKPMVFAEFESEVDAILMGWGTATDDAAFLEIISGNVEPSGLLPLQMPASMETVEAQYEDVPRDMECHVDADGNTYDFTFGLNWSGVINDERVAKYNVDPIVGEDPFQ